MNKDNLVTIGLEILEKADINEINALYDKWKADVLTYVKGHELDAGEYKLHLHVTLTPYESAEIRIEKMKKCINDTILCLQGEEEDRIPSDTLESVIDNFGLCLYNMFSVAPDKKASLTENVLKQITIQNEYDVQHIMYAVIKALYPSARREVPDDIGYASDRYDIFIEELDAIVEIKCTRKDHSEKKLFRELGEDAFFYNCSKLIMYIYDKNSVITDVNNFVKALERTDSGKEIKVFVEQTKELI